MTNLVIPEKTLHQHIIILGKTGAGKSSVMRGAFIEPLLDAGEPVCILDPKGDHWGLKSSADGKRAGYPVVIFGGEHADVPLNERAGAHVAELVATGNRPCIIDLGGWMVGERTRFFVDFASTLFKHTRGRRWLLIDEAHNFAPQGSVRALDPDSAKMLHWANRLASEGRGKGINLIAASQRPQKVHKDFITSMETLVAMRVIHKLDRDAIKDWIDGCADPAKGREVLAALANMPRGEAWVWSPEIGFGPQHIRFPLFKTYDSFKPQHADIGAKLKGWAEVDLAEVTARLESVVKEAEAKDPAKLHARIRELEGQLRQQKPASTPAHTVKKVEVPALRHGEIKELKKFLSIVESIIKRATDVKYTLESAIDNAKTISENIRVALTPAVVVHQKAVLPPHKFPNLNHGWNAGTLPNPQQRILDAIAWFESLGISEPNQGAVAFMANYKPTGGAFNNPKARLRINGFIEYRGSNLALTEAGRAHARFPDAAPTNEELHRRVLDRLPGPERKLLTPLIEVYPGVLPDTELAERAGYAPTGGAFNNPKGRLRTLGLVTYPASKCARAADLLFPLTGATT